MNNRVEYKLGEVFEYDGKKLKVVETESYSCRGCYFLNLRDECYPHLCLLSERKDRKDVIFKPVE